MNRCYNKENLMEVVLECFSYAQVLNKLGLRECGGNYNTLKKYISLYEIDISHFTHNAWRKGKDNTDEVSFIKLDDILKENTNYKSHYLKNKIVTNGLKEYKCEVCGLTDWNNKPITLELHHLNGNHYDNRLENLQLVCPNCHSQTPNYKGRNRDKKYIENNIPKPFKKDKIIIKCLNCGKEFESERYKRKYCSRECYNEAQRNIQSITNSSKSYSITYDDLISNMYNFKTITSLASYYNTHRETIRNILKHYNLYDTFKEHCLKK